MKSNNPHGFEKVGVFDQLTITHASGSELFALGHLAQTFPHKELCVIYIPTEMFF